MTFETQYLTRFRLEAASASEAFLKRYTMSGEIQLLPLCVIAYKLDCDFNQISDSIAATKRIAANEYRCLAESAYQRNMYVDFCKMPAFVQDYIISKITETNHTMQPINCHIVHDYYNRCLTIMKNILSQILSESDTDRLIDFFSPYRIWRCFESVKHRFIPQNVIDLQQRLNSSENKNIADVAHSAIKESSSIYMDKQFAAYVHIITQLIPNYDNYDVITSYNGLSALTLEDMFYNMLLCLSAHYELSSSEDSTRFSTTPLI